MVIGIIPGLGPSVGIALLLPISFSMSPTAALVMMTIMYTTGVYGGSITAVLCHTPGTATSAATTMDGYEMTKQGRGMEAISVVTVASVVGGIIGGICLILFAPALGKISLMFSTLEYFLVACFGVLVVAGLTGENQAKGIFAALFGLLIGCIGMDSISGVSRFTFGQLWLEDGLGFDSDSDWPVFHLPGTDSGGEADARYGFHDCGGSQRRSEGKTLEQG